MELKILENFLIKSAKKNKKVFILGRGFSTALFLKNLKKFKKNNLIIGYNTNEIIEDLDFYFTNKNRIPNSIPKKKLFQIKKILKLIKNDNKIYKIGSIEYSIDPLMNIFNNFLKNKGIKKP